jgi:hypothetical protein
VEEQIIEQVYSLNYVFVILIFCVLFLLQRDKINEVKAKISQNEEIIRKQLLNVIKPVVLR